MNELESDVHLLCDNAQTYNEDGSLIFNDSLILKQVWDVTRSRLAEETNQTMRELERELNRETSQQPEDEESRSSLSVTPAPATNIGETEPRVETKPQEPVTPSGSTPSEDGQNSCSRSDDGKVILVLVRHGMDKVETSRLNE